MQLFLDQARARVDHDLRRAGRTRKGDRGNAVCSRRHRDGDGRAEMRPVAARARGMDRGAAGPDRPEPILRVDGERHVRVAAREGALEADAVTRRRARAERDDGDRRRRRIAGRPREERVPGVIGDERSFVLGDGLEGGRRCRCEVGAERLVDHCAVRVCVRVERGLHEPAAVDRERLVIAAATCVDVLRLLAVQAAEDVDEPGAVLGEAGRAVRHECGRLDAARRVRLGLDGAAPGHSVVSRGRARDAVRIREVELDRAARLLHELRLPGARISRHDRLRWAAVARDDDCPGGR